MDNLVYLLNVRMSGIKSIKNEIRLDFYKKTVDKNFDPDKFRVKAIYGENGSGKTAIITGIKIFQDLMLSNQYLNESKNQRFLDEIINKEIELTSQKIKNFEIKIREQKYTAIKTYAEKTGGILTISETELPTGKIANLNEPKPPEWPNGCSGMYSKNNPIGLLALQNQKESGMIQGDIKRYFSGESGKFTFERMMLKSDKGWVFQ